jgi:hypothetical protein
MLKKNFIRDGNRRIIGSVTAGYSDTSKTVRDDHNRIAGRTSDLFTPCATRMATWFPSTPLIPVC